jgi:hypothetical protein
MERERGGRVVARAALAGALACAVAAATACAPSAPDDTDERAEGWTRPERLGDVGGDLTGSPMVLATAAGRIVLVWIASVGGTMTLQARDGGASTGWSPAVQLHSGEPANVIGPVRLGLDTSGNGFAAWLEILPSERRLVISRFTAGQGWSTPRVMERRADEDVFDGLALAVDPSGDAILAWSTQNVSRAYVYAGRWSEPIPIAAREGDRRLGSTVAAVNGRVAVVAWTRNEFSVDAPTDPGEARAVRIDLSTGLAEEATVTRSHSAHAAAAHVDPAGRAVVLEDALTIARWMRYEPGAGWLAPEPFGEGDIRALAGGEGAGMLALVDRTDNDGRHRLYARDLVTGSGWTEGAQVLEFSAAAPWGPVDAEVASATGDAYVLSQQAADVAWLAHRAAGAWTAERVPGPTTTLAASCRFPQGVLGCLWITRLAVDPGGSAWVAWQQQDPFGTSIWIQRKLPRTE